MIIKSIWKDANQNKKNLSFTQYLSQVTYVFLEHSGDIDDLVYIYWYFRHGSWKKNLIWNILVSIYVLGTEVGRRTFDGAAIVFSAVLQCWTTAQGNPPSSNVDKNKKDECETVTIVCQQMNRDDFDILD